MKWRNTCATASSSKAELELDECQKSKPKLEGSRHKIALYTFVNWKRCATISSFVNFNIYLYSKPPYHTQSQGDRRHKL